MVPTIWAGIDLLKARKKLLESFDHHAAFCLGPGDFSYGVEEGPSRWAEVVWEAYPHLPVFDIASPQEDVEEGNIHADVSREAVVDCAIKALSPFLNTVEVMSCEPPSSPYHQFVLGLQCAPGLCNITPEVIEFSIPGSYSEPIVQQHDCSLSMLATIKV